jgi:phospholipid/cholesterol/gamma-HCH transport system permease protein
MPAQTDLLRADAQARAEGDVLRVELRGPWKMTQPRPAWPKLVGRQTPSRVRLAIVDVGDWDSSLIVFISTVQHWCRDRGAAFETEAMPADVQELLSQFSAAQAKEAPPPAKPPAGFLAAVGYAGADVWRKFGELTQFVGEVTLSSLYLLRRPRKFRWGDCLEEIEKCGAMALPIVGLISLLVGLTLAYVAAVLLRQFGADIYVADFVGLVVVREMGPVMTAIVMAGRTGAAFAATLANMKTNEEVDALTTFGFRPVDFLVMPRMVALGLMMPLLVLYANALGIIGGLMVSATILQIPPSAYWVEMLTAVDLSDLCSGLIKALTFGVIVGLSGCLRGLQSDRSAAGVGQAATSAVVTAILLIIVADSVYAVVFNYLGL